MQDIFVQVAAYRDPELQHTLDSLFTCARHPERLRVRVCLQRAEEDPPLTSPKGANVEIDEVDYRRSRGANWARRRVQRQWRGEAYTLIVDSHLRFALDWDRKLVAMLEALRSAGSARPILTCYPPDCDPDTFPARRSWRPLKNYKEGYIAGLLLHFAGHELALPTWLKGPVPAEFLALGLLFADGRFNMDVPFDPKIYFFGDEITTGLRAWCHGYEFFHPHRVVAWHVYDRARRRCHWEDHRDWETLDARSLARARRILGGYGFAGYPIGSERTPASYERRIGMPLLLDATK